MQLIDRTINLLVLLSKEENGLTVSEISEVIGIPNSSAHRILQSLIKNNFVVQSSETKKYMLGYQAITLGDNISKNNHLSVTAHEYMESLANHVGETVALSVLHRESLLTIDYVESSTFMQLMIKKGVGMPALLTSAGKAILAYQPVERLENVYNNIQADSKFNMKLRSLGAYIDELNEVSENGYSLIDEELQPGIYGIASPIFDNSNNVIAAISITAIKDNGNIKDNTIELLKKTAQDISIALGAKK